MAKQTFTLKVALMSMFEISDTDVSTKNQENTNAGRKCAMSRDGHFCLLVRSFGAI